MKAKDQLGRHGEEVAAGYLLTQGMQLLDRNWRCSDGEIDIVAIDGDTLVIAEVKTRRNLDFGHPFEAVDAAKLARLHRLSAMWCRDHEMSVGSRRVDVVAVVDGGAGEPHVEHLRGVG